MSKVVVKVRFGPLGQPQEIRRISLDVPSYRAVLESVASMFKLQVPLSTIALHYRDDEGDDVAIGSDLELEESLRVMQGKPLKLQVSLLEPASIPSSKPVEASGATPMDCKEDPMQAPLEVKQQPKEQPKEPKKELAPISEGKVEVKAEAKVEAKAEEKMKWWEFVQDGKLRELGAMFPLLDREVVEAILVKHGGKLDSAVEALLAFNSKAPSDKELKELRSIQLKDLIGKINGMVTDPTAIRLAGKYGLNIVQISYEDNVRSRHSVWGPCISDMSLMVENRMLPMIRLPNYQDVTWDLPIDRINLVVGNERQGAKGVVSLRYYLENFRTYLSKPQDWSGEISSLLGHKDTHAICSAQACFLPVPRGGEANFNVGIRNPRARRHDPPVLAIIATAEGTSAQVVECDTFSEIQKLYFNKQGQQASFVGHRLVDDRRARGVAEEGEMSAEEKDQNLIAIIQVPLRQTRIPEARSEFKKSVGSWLGFGAPAACDAAAGGGSAFGGAPGAPLRKRDFRDGRAKAKHREERRDFLHEDADVDQAIVRVGDAEGPFTECNKIAIVRDPYFPVRVTFQFYKSTANGIIDEAAIQMISNQIKEKQKNASFLGSLVIGDARRPTAVAPVRPFIPTPPRIPPAPWWDVFWDTYKHDYFISKVEASVVVEHLFVIETLDQATTPLRRTLHEYTHESRPRPRPRPRPHHHYHDH